MHMDRLFSWRKGTNFFLNCRGSMVIWLIAAICFVIVLLGIAFVLLSGKTADNKPQTVPVALKQEIREPVKRYTLSSPASTKSEKPGPGPGASVEAGLQKKSDPRVEAPSDDDPSRIRNVLPEDPPGKGILSQQLDKTETPALSESREDPQIPSSSSAVKPPLVSGNPQLTEKTLPPNDDKPALAVPPEVSSPSEASQARPSEGPAGVKAESVEKDREKLTVMAVMGNVREGPSVKEKVIFTVARGDTVQVTDQKGNWYAVLLEDGRSGWAHRTLLHAPSPSLKKEAPSGPETGKGKVIQGIRTVVTDPNQAQIVFELNGYYPPEIMVIEGKVPRVVCDFPGARLAPGVRQNLPVTTGVVKRIRVGVHKGQTPKVRVVLDLQDGQNYAVEQFFFEKENYYAIMVSAGK